MPWEGLNLRSELSDTQHWREFALSMQCRCSLPRTSSINVWSIKKQSHFIILLEGKLHMVQVWAPPINVWIVRVVLTNGISLDTTCLKCACAVGLILLCFCHYHEKSILYCPSAWDSEWGLWVGTWNRTLHSLKQSCFSWPSDAQ